MKMIAIVLASLCLAYFLMNNFPGNSKSAFDAYQSDSQEPNNEEIFSMIEGRCSGPEEIDRKLLHRTWFFTPEYRNYAIVFDPVSFGIREQHDLANLKEAAYCIEGNTLQIQFFTTKFIPTKFESGELILTPKRSKESKGVIVITEISSKEMSFILDEGEEITVYTNS